MIDKHKYVFIIGAGASMPYGFPSGSELYEIIKTKIVEFILDYRTKVYSPRHDPIDLVKQAEKFAKALEQTSSVSIDKYININPKFKSIGLQGIAAAIIQCEKNSRLPINNTIKFDDWYSYLFGKLIEGLDTAQDLLKIGENKISFITFNYDRSLEYYISTNFTGLLRHSDIEENEITGSLRQLKFIHVYGQVGLMPYQIANESQMNYLLDYGGNQNTLIENANAIIPLIDVMYATRVSSQAVLEAKQLIQDAEVIFFLGFGFDTRNLEILGFPVDINQKIVLGTAFEKTTNERMHFQSKVSFNVSSTDEFLYDCTTTHLLREYLI